MANFWAQNSYLLSSLAIYATLGWSLYVTMRVGTLFLGQPAMMAAGAYVAAWCSLNLEEIPWPITVAIAIVVGVMVSVGAGYLVRNMGSLYAALISLAMVELVRIAVIAFPGTTGGAIGLIGIPRRSSELQILLIALLVGAIFWYLQRSQLGLELDSVRESDMSAQAVGRNVGRARVVAFGISGGVAALAGALNVHLLQYTSPDAYSFNLILQVTTVAVIGGVGFWWGPPLGAAFVTLVPEMVDSTSEYASIVYGVALILTVLFVRGGVSGGISRLVKWALQKATSLRGVEATEVPT